MIKCFVFDIQGVLFEAGSSIRKRLEKEGYDLNLLKDISGDGKYGRDYFLGKISLDEYIERVKKVFPNGYQHILDEYFSGEKPLSFHSNDFKKIFEKEKIDLPEHIFDNETFLMLDLVSTLSKNYDLAILSGNSRERLYGIDKKHPFIHYFKYKTFSYEVGYTKPDPKIYEILLNTIPYPANECIYFDDSQKNVDGGKSAGLISYIVTNPAV